MQLGRVWALPLWVHLGVLVVLLVVLAPFMRLGSTAWVEEEGRLGLQVEALDGGGWGYDYTGESFDPDGRWAPVTPDPTGTERLVPSARHPAHVAILTAVAGIVGVGATLYLIPIVGLALAAVAAWLLGGEFESRGSRPAFWLVAAGPLLVNAYVLWAYTLVAAAAGLALLAALRIAQFGPTWWRGLGLATALAVGAALSPEGVWFAGGLTVVLVAALGWRRRWSGALLVGAWSMLGVAVAFGGSQLWVERITGTWRGFDTLWVDVGGSGVLDRLETRVGAAWRFVFDGGNVAFDTERLMVVALVAALGGGLFLRMRGREGRFVGATVACVSAIGIVVLFGVRSADAPLLPVLGLLAAWPVVLLGIAAAPWKEATRRERLVVAIAGVSALAVVIALPDGGSEREWGGRLLAPVVVPIAVVAGAGLVRRLRERSWEQQGVIIAALVLLTAFPTSQGLETVRDFRGSNAQVGSALERVATEVVVIDNPRLVRMPVFSWGLNEQVDWFVSYGETPALLAALADAGVEELTILPDPARPTLDIAPYSMGEAVEAPGLEARGIPVFLLSGPVSSAIEA